MYELLCSLGCAEPGARMSLAEFKKGVDKFATGKELLSAIELAKIFYMINTNGSHPHHITLYTIHYFTNI
jgi:hypothetical protein